MSIRKRFDLVILDWAGTLVDFGCCAPVAALREVFAKHGVALTDAEARSDMGKAKADHVRAILENPQVRPRWVAARGELKLEADVLELAHDLEPVMRAQAVRAAQLIAGARESIAALRSEGVRVASSTGYTRDMMLPALEEAAKQGYTPDHLVCSGETPAGRPTPLMIYKACAELGVWPLSRVVKVDDTPVGILEGRAAGCLTIGVAASGNGVGLSEAALAALSSGDREQRVAHARHALQAAGADVVIDTVADLIPALRAQCADA